MNKKLKTITFFSLIGLLITFASCSPYKSIEVGKSKDIQVHSIQTNKIEASLFLPIKNPNFYGIKVKEIDATVYVNNKKAGKASSSETLKISANSDKTQELKFEIDFSDIGSDGLSILKIIKDRQIDLKLEGTITAKTLFTRKEMDFIKKRSISLKD